MKIGAKILAMAALVALAACDNIGAEYPSDTIRFAVGGEIDINSRAIIDQESVNNTETPVRVTAKRGSTTIYNAEQIFRDANTSEWLPTSNRRQSWQTGVAYEFYATSFSPSTAKSNGGLNMVSDTRFTITEPKEYDASGDSWVDYLLSHKFVQTVPEGMQPPIVKLDMEHAVSLVEINIAKHISFEHIDVYLKEISLEGFYRSADMECLTHVQYGRGESLGWKYTNVGTMDAVYQIVGDEPTAVSGRKPLEVRGSEGGIRMRFLATPQQLGSSCVLKIGVWVNEKYNEEAEDKFVLNEYSFNLYQFATSEGVAIWKPAHHILYTLEVDTGIRLEGSISPWIDVDYIEGTVLPHK